MYRNSGPAQARCSCDLSLSFDDCAFCMAKRGETPYFVCPHCRHALIEDDLQQSRFQCPKCSRTSVRRSAEVCFEPAIAVDPVVEKVEVMLPPPPPKSFFARIRALFS